MTSFFIPFRKTCRPLHNYNATNQKWAWCLTDLSGQMCVRSLSEVKGGWWRCCFTPVSVFVSRNRRNANTALVHSPTSRLRVRADRPPCSAVRPRCLLYHWPFHIPQPAREVGPHWLQHCLLCLNLASSLAGLYVSDRDMWTCCPLCFLFSTECLPTFSTSATPNCCHELLSEIGKILKEVLIVPASVCWNWMGCLHWCNLCTILSKQGWRNAIFGNKMSETLVWLTTRLTQITGVLQSFRHLRVTC